MKKATWARTLTSIALSITALAWATLPAGAQLTPKQPRTSGAASPPMQMRSVSNAQRKAAAEQLAAKRTAARAHKVAPSNSPVNLNSRNGSDQR
jgi:hypothetical protein